MANPAVFTDLNKDETMRRVWRYQWNNQNP
jgi:hypothetical protein